MVESTTSKTFDKLDSVQALKAYYDSEIIKTHLKELLSKGERNSAMTSSLDDQIILDFTHTKLDCKAFELL